MLTEKVNEKTVLTSNSYNISKNLVQLWIPALASLYFGLAKIWGFPYAEEIVGTLALVATFLGVVLHVAGSNYDAAGAAFDGQMVVHQDPATGKLVYSLELDGDPADIQNKDSVAFKVSPAPDETPAVESADLPPPQ